MVMPRKWKKDIYFRTLFRLSYLESLRDGGRVDATFEEVTGSVQQRPAQDHNRGCTVTCNNGCDGPEYIFKV